MAKGAPGGSPGLLNQDSATPVGSGLVCEGAAATPGSAGLFFVEDVPDDGDCAFEAVRRALRSVDGVSSRRELQLAAGIRFRDRARAVGNGGVALTDYFTMRDYVGSRVQRGLDVDDDQAQQQTQPLV